MTLGCVRVYLIARLGRDGRVEQAHAKGVILSIHKSQAGASQAKLASALNRQLDTTDFLDLLRRLMLI